MDCHIINRNINNGKSDNSHNTIVCIDWGYNSHPQDKNCKILGNRFIVPQAGAHFIKIVYNRPSVNILFWGGAYIMVIDAYTHIVPPKYHAALGKMAVSGKIRPLDDLSTREFQVAGMINLEDRFKRMDLTPEVKDVISVTGPFLENIAGPKEAVELARIANDEVAEIVNKYPDRFVAGVAFLPLNDIEQTLREIDRAINELKLRGIEIGTDVNGKALDAPELMPVYEKMQNYDLPIYIHPSKNSFFPDYPEEVGSRYGLAGAIGWPHATSMA
ncbi:MAG: hypothetical protein EHM12_06245, partial [Dehalococcoidia bacterium]